MAAGSGLEGNRESLQLSAANTPDMPPDDVDCIECYLASGHFQQWQLLVPSYLVAP